MNKSTTFILLICVLALAALAVIIFALFHEGETDMTYGNNVHRHITPSQARAKMQAHPEAIILDVRTQQEYAAGRIPGAILLPDFDVEAQAPYVLPDKDAIILVYCRSGRRSENAARLLASMGYTNVYDFGGIEFWPYERE